MFDANDTQAIPADYDFLILGSSVILMKMTIRKWVGASRDGIKKKPTLLFSVSGVTADDPLLQSWLRASHPEELVERACHFGLGDRLDVSKFSWWMRLIMKLVRTQNQRQKRNETCWKDSIELIKPALHPSSIGQRQIRKTGLRRSCVRGWCAIPQRSLNAIQNIGPFFTSSVNKYYQASL